MGDEGEDQSSDRLDRVLLLGWLAWVEKREVILLVGKGANNQESAQSHDEVHEAHLPFGAHVLQTNASNYHEYAQNVKEHGEIENGTTTAMLHSDVNITGVGIIIIKRHLYRSREMLRSTYSIRVAPNIDRHHHKLA